MKPSWPAYFLIGAIAATCLPAAYAALLLWGFLPRQRSSTMAAYLPRMSALIPH